MTAALQSDYFRRDQEHGITAADLSKDCDFAEHVVRARGKRTRFTSVSLDKTKIDDFGPALYLALRASIAKDGHALIEHAELIASLRASATSTEKAERVRAIQAMKYATRRKEGLIEWRIDIGGIERKELISFAHKAIQQYFKRV